MRAARRSIFTFVLLAAVSLAGCNGEDDITGTYTGTVQVTAFGIQLSIPTRITLSQSGSSLSGTFEATQPTGAVNRGTVNGSINGSAVKLSLTPTAVSAVDCPAQLDGTRSGNTISGSITVSCPGQPPLPGTFTVAKQSS